MMAADVIFTIYHFYSSAIQDYLMHQETDASVSLLSKLPKTPSRQDSTTI